MAYDLSGVLVIGISSRSLFDLEAENRLFEEQGREAYIHHQIENEDVILRPGAAFPLVRALLALNDRAQERVVEVIVTSRNQPDSGLRIFNSIRHYGLDITRAAFTGGEALRPYLEAFAVNLFLSRSEPDVQAAIDAGFPAALVYDPPTEYEAAAEQIRIAFDADAVLFSEESEAIYKRHGLEAFYDNERENARHPLAEGPFAKLLLRLGQLQHTDGDGPSPLHIGIITARQSPAHERVIRTLRGWGVRVDAAFFLGGLSKDQVLKAFRAHIFFDDQETHLGAASRVVPSARVPYKTGSVLSPQAILEVMPPG